MQFSCESCKTQLQIADEKVRGKRLIVRCKRCGAKIAISDPALAKSAPRMVAPPPAAHAAAAQAAAAPRPVEKPAASKPPPAAAAAAAKAPHRDTDTESTRAMDSDLLEKALEASKADEPAAVQNGAPAPSRPPPPPAEPPPAEAPIWFAMIQGKQEGPFTRGELEAMTGHGEVGPRTYLWKDGMGAWQRAKDLPEVALLFPEAPPPSVPPPPPIAAPFSTPDFVTKAEIAPLEKSLPPPPVATPVPDGSPKEERTSVDPLPLGERVHQEEVARDLFPAEPSQKNAADLARWASDELAKKSKPTPQRTFFESAAPSRSGPGPFAVFVVLAVLVAGGVATWLAIGSNEKVEEPKPSQEAQAVAPVAAVPASKPEPPAAQPAEKTAPPADQKPAAPAPPAEPPKPAEPPQQPSGLTADQVRKKLDENKSALQSCIDEALRRDPNLRVGKIHISTTIAPSGQVTSAKIDKRTVDESPLGGCLKRATRRIAFPTFSGDAFDVDIPIVVTAGE